jgi:hypothetical protein
MQQTNGKSDVPRTLAQGTSAPDKRLFGAALNEAMTGVAALLTPEDDEEEEEDGEDDDDEEGSGSEASSSSSDDDAGANVENETEVGLSTS